MNGTVDKCMERAVTACVHKKQQFTKVQYSLNTVVMFSR